jgi:hypothetical protein
MAKLSSQFYAAPSENASFVRDVMASHPVKVGLVHKVPFSLERVAVGARLADGSVAGADWVVFAIEEFDDSSRDVRGFRDAHPDALTLELGRLDESGLRESWLHAKSESAEAMAIWRRVARELRGRTYSGVVALDETSGEPGPMLPAWRCTEGARELFVKGVRILPVAGKTRLAILKRPKPAAE